MIEALSYALGYVLQLLPRRVLIRWLGRRLRGASNATWFSAFFSGRVALNAVAASLPSPRRCVCIPRYLCNVVHKAFAREGWTIVLYEFDEHFRPDVTAMRQLIAESRPDVFLLAPLYGSDGGLDWWLSEEGQRLRSESGLKLVVDFCQDASLFERYADRMGRDWIAVFSFNDKSFPGLMGGAVVANVAVVPEPSAPSISVSFKLTRVLFFKYLARIRRKSGPGSSAFEFSVCNRFPYTFDIQGACKLQVAIGLVGTYLMNYWRNVRRRAIQAGAVAPVIYSFTSSSPFVVVTGNDPGLHKAKAPYADPFDPKSSPLPALMIRHNKGFDDAA